MKWTIAIIMASALGCGGAEPPGEEVFPAGPFKTMKSDHGELTIEIRTAPEQPPGRGLSSVEYRITGEDGLPRDELALSVVPWMPAMGHGASTTPIITAKGGGRYVASEVSMFMPGRWDLRTTIAGPVKDSVTIALQIP